MSTHRDDWWVNVTRMVRNYPARRREYDALTAVAVTANTSGMPGGGGEPHRTTEDVALRTMAPAKQAEYEAVTRAISVTQQMPNGTQRMDLIRRIYWSGHHQTITQASAAVYIAEATGWRWHRAFIRLVAEMYGYIV